MKIPIMICDDNKVFAKTLASKVDVGASLLDENLERREIDLKEKVIINSYIDSLNFIEQSEWKAGIYFLDIELNEKDFKSKNGFDLAQKIKEKDKDAQIIFITSHSEMAFLTFERKLGPVDYIVKDLNEFELQDRVNSSLQQAVKKIMTLPKDISEIFEYKFGRRIIRLALDKVILLETATLSHKLILVKSIGNSLISGNLQDFEKHYPGLARVSQSCLVNPKHVKEINVSNNELILSNGQTIKYSRKLRTTIKDKLTL